MMRNAVETVAGLALLAGAWWVHQRDLYQQIHGTETEGVIVHHDVWRQRDTTKKDFLQPDTYTVTYAPIVEYSAQGRRLQCKGSYNTTPPSIGKPVIVRYDPQDPAATARIVDPLEGLTPWAMAALGLYAAVPALWRMVRPTLPTSEAPW